MMERTPTFQSRHIAASPAVSAKYHMALVVTALPKLYPLEAMGHRIELPLHVTEAQHNPSVLNDNGVLRVTLRARSTVTLQTTNYLGAVDPKTWELTGAKLITPAIPWLPSVRPPEDLRLFRWRGGLYAVGVVHDMPAHALYQSLMGLDMETATITSAATQISERHEKNWMPCVVGDSDLRMIYSLDPLIVLSVTSDVKVTPALKTLQQTVGMSRGGSQLVPWKGGWLAIVHQVYRPTRPDPQFNNLLSGFWPTLIEEPQTAAPVVYLHRFARFNADLTHVELGAPWYFHWLGIEFCAGLTWWGSRLVAGFGVADREAWLAEIEPDTIDATFLDAGVGVDAVGVEEQRLDVRELSTATKRLTIAYITFRCRPRFEWFCASLKREFLATPSVSPDDVQILVIDSRLWHGEVARRVEMFHAAAGRIAFEHRPPKPSPWQGPNRQTSRDYFCAAGARNTAFALAQGAHVAFVDDLSVLRPGWLKAHAQAALEGYVLAGTTSKRKGLLVDVRGGIIPGQDHPPGRDSRLPMITKDGQVCPGSWLYGGTFSVPLELALSVNGQDEIHDSIGGEDYDFGLRLERAGAVIRITSACGTYEDEDAHHAETSMIRLDKPWPGADGPYSSNYLLYKLLKERTRTETIGNDFVLRELRDVMLAGGTFPTPSEGIRHWVDGQPLSEM